MSSIYDLSDDYQVGYATDGSDHTYSTPKKPKVHGNNLPKNIVDPCVQNMSIHEVHKFTNMLVQCSFASLLLLSNRKLNVKKK